MNVPNHARLVLLLAAAILLVAPKAFAQTDEIQVYDASIADQGKFNLTWHNNFTPDGQKTASFPIDLLTASPNGPTARPTGSSWVCISRFTASRKVTEPRSTAASSVFSSSSR